MNSIKIKLIALLMVSIYTTSNSASGQENTNASKGDSLILSDVISTSIQNYPTIKSAEESVNSADARISLAKTGYLPDVDYTANYSRIGPVSSVTIPNLGSFDFYPANNYNTSLNYRQSIYDFGRTSKSISAEKEGKELLKESLNITKQKVSLSVIANFYTILYLQKAIVIKQQQLNTLNEHLDFINKKKETGSAIDYDILSTQVRISSVESQKMDIEASLRIQTSILNSFMGKPINEACQVKDPLNTIIPQVNQDSIVSYAYLHRDEMLMTQSRANLAQLRYDIAKVQNYPILSLMLSGGYKNGYSPDLDKLKANYVAGIGLKVPIFDANRTKYNKSIAKSSILTTNLETETLKRNISNEVVESSTNVDVAKKKVSQFELQLVQAQKALSLAKIKFQDGTITNLDLLDATTNVSESQLLLLKSKIDYIISIYRLKAAIGDRLY